MSDFLNKAFDKFPAWFKTIFDHNRWKTLVILGFGTLSGCLLLGSKTDSVLYDGKKVNRDQLYAEYQTVLAKYDAATKDLDEKDAMRAKAVEILTSLSNTLPTPFGPLAGAGFGLLLGAAGGTLDKRKADRQIEVLKTQPKAG